MKELTKVSTQPGEGSSDPKGDKKEQKQPQPDNTSQKPGSENRNYALDEGDEVLAVLKYDALPGIAPACVNDNRRIS